MRRMMQPEQRAKLPSILIAEDPSGDGAWYFRTKDPWCAGFFEEFDAPGQTPNVVAGHLHLWATHVLEVGRHNLTQEDLDRAVKQLSRAYLSEEGEQVAVSGDLEVELNTMRPPRWLLADAPYEREDLAHYYYVLCTAPFSCFIFWSIPAGGMLRGQCLFTDTEPCEFDALFNEAHEYLLERFKVAAELGIDP